MGTFPPTDASYLPCPISAAPLGVEAAEEADGALLAGGVSGIGRIATLASQALSHACRRWGVGVGQLVLCFVLCLHQYSTRGSLPGW